MAEFELLSFFVACALCYFALDALGYKWLLSPFQCFGAISMYSFAITQAVGSALFLVDSNCSGLSKLGRPENLLLFIIAIYLLVNFISREYFKFGSIIRHDLKFFVKIFYLYAVLFGCPLWLRTIGGELTIELNTAHFDRFYNTLITAWSTFDSRLLLDHVTYVNIFDSLSVKLRQAYAASGLRGHIMIPWHSGLAVVAAATPASLQFLHYFLLNERLFMSISTSMIEPYIKLLWLMSVDSAFAAFDDPDIETQWWLKRSENAVCGTRFMGLVGIIRISLFLVFLAGFLKSRKNSGR